MNKVMFSTFCLLAGQFVSIVAQILMNFYLILLGEGLGFTGSLSSSSVVDIEIYS